MSLPFLPQISRATFRDLFDDVRLLTPRVLVSGTLIVVVALAALSGLAIVLLLPLLGLLALTVLDRRPPLGLVLLIPASLAVPFTVGTGTGTRLNATILLLALLLALWFSRAVARRELRLARSPVIPPLLALLCAALISFIAGAQPWLVFARTAPLTAQLGGLAIFGLSAGAFLLVAFQVRDLRWLRWMTWIFLAFGALHVIGRVTPGLGRLASLALQPGADGSLFWTWLVALAASQALFNRSLGRPWRLVLAGVTVLTLYIGFFPNRDWTSGWLPPLAALVVILWAGAPRLALPATLAAGLAVVFTSQRVANMVMGGDNSYSLSTRSEAAGILTDLVQRANPLIGLGPANYFWYTPLVPISGYRVSFNSHSNYIDLLAQTGIVGLGCFVWFVAALAWVGWKARARAAEGFPRAYVYGALGGLAGTLVAAGLGDWVLPFVYNVGLLGFRASVLGWLFLGGLLAVAREADTRSPPDADDRI